MKGSKRQRLVEQVELLKDARRYTRTYDQEVAGAPDYITKDEVEISRAELDPEVGDYLEQFLDEMGSIPVMPRLDLRSQESALEAIKLIEERMSAIEKRRRTANALQRLITGRVTEQ